MLLLWVDWTAVGRGVVWGVVMVLGAVEDLELAGRLPAALHSG